MVLRRAVLLSLILAASALTAAAGPYGEAVLLCRFQDPAVRESSGLASSGRSADYFFTHNDSGDAARFFAVNRGGETLASFRVAGAVNVDWEEMARGSDDNGMPALYIGDIGDNGARRSSITVYRVREPEVDPGRRGVAAETGPAVRFELKYEDGPRDAETLLVHPATGQLFIVSKALAGSAVYAAPKMLRTDAVNELKKVASINFGALPSSARTLKDQVRRLLATSGDIAPDGTALVVRTYMDAYEWKLTGDVAAAFRRAPAHVPVPLTSQAEAIAYGRGAASLLTSSEGTSAPVHELLRR
jgi:hypothetical protein